MRLRSGPASGFGNHRAGGSAATSSPPPAVGTAILPCLGTIFGPDDDGGGPGLIIDGVRIPFQMEAQVSYGPPSEDPDDGSDWDDDAPWMIHLPVELQVTIPHEILYPPALPPPALPDVQADAKPDPESATWGPDAFPLPPGSRGGSGRNRRRPIGIEALDSLRLDETLDRTAGGRLGLPVLPGPIRARDASSGTRDAGSDPDELVDLGRLPGGGAGGGTTGHRALDAVFAAGPVAGLDRVPRRPGPTEIGSGAGTAIQPASRHRAADGPAIGPMSAGSAGDMPIEAMSPSAPSPGAASPDAAVRPAASGGATTAERPGLAGFRQRHGRAATRDAGGRSGACGAFERPAGTGRAGG